MSALRILEKHELANVHPVGINPGKMQLKNIIKKLLQINCYRS